MRKNTFLRKNEGPTPSKKGGLNIKKNRFQYLDYPPPYGRNVDPAPYKDPIPSTDLDYVFALENSTSPPDFLYQQGPDSKLWVFDYNSNPAVPPSFSWTPPASDVPEFKNANEILVNGNDIFIFYYFRNPNAAAGSFLERPWDHSNPSRLVKFSDVVIDFPGSSITYSSAEVVELTKGVGIHGITKNSTHIYASQRSYPVGGSYTEDTGIFKIPLSGALTFERFIPSDGGFTEEGVFEDWYGAPFEQPEALQPSPFTEYFGVDYRGADEIHVHGDYLYLDIGVHLITSSGKEFFSSGNHGWSVWRKAIGRLPLSDLTAPVEVVYVGDGRGMTGDFQNSQFIARGNYLYAHMGLRIFGSVFAEIDLRDPSKIRSQDQESTNRGVFFDRSAENPLRVGDVITDPHGLAFWGDKLVFTTSSNSLSPVLGIVDINEKVAVEAYLDIMWPIIDLGLTRLPPFDYDRTDIQDFKTSVSVTDDIAVVGDYAYVGLEYRGSSYSTGYTMAVLSVDLNNPTPSGVSICSTMTNGCYSVYHPNQII